jgi:poly(3-hydroxybutyrate) depolymerase
MRFPQALLFLLVGVGFSFAGSAPAQSQGKTINGTLYWNGLTRYYQLYLPPKLPANPPMLLMLHGTSYAVPPNNPSTENWSWQAVADTYEFILVQPASTYDKNTGQWNWNAYFMDSAFPYDQGCGNPSCPDDSGFLRRLIGKLSTKYQVNPKAIYVAGMSSGAQMAERVGVELSDLVAAISPASGQLVGQQDPPPGLPGNALAPISVLEWHGTNDHNLWPCNYGTTKYSGVTFTLDTVDDTFNYWTSQNACTTFQTSQPLCLSGEPNNANDAPTPGMPGYTGNIASGCTSKVEVQFVWEPDTAHSWVQKNNTARWLFFAAHPKR